MLSLAGASVLTAPSLASSGFVQGKKEALDRGKEKAAWVFKTEAASLLL